jgi:hypothetical protein
MTSPRTIAATTPMITSATVPNQSGSSPPASAGSRDGGTVSSGEGGSSGAASAVAVASGLNRSSCGAERVAASEARKSSPRTAASGHQRRSAARSKTPGP